MSMTPENCAEKAARRVPRGEKRREEIAAVAERVFLRRGFAETTMQIIAEEAGASKETLYRHFGSKEGLFSEVIRSRSVRITGGNEGELCVEASPHEILRDLGLNLLRFLVSPDSLCLYRAIVTEVPREPELARIFYTQGPARLLNQFTRYLISATRRGTLCCPEPELAAKLFIGAVVANYQLIGLLALDEDTFSDQRMRAHIDEAVDMFLARYGTPSAGGAAHVAPQKGAKP
ncbi:MAG TPA: TetR/AcrR family transcriptional regulator [Methylocella sp.]|nr:TetR/AcrR family transcriptional regulator [Methylocella sp.]